MHRPILSATGAQVGPGTFVTLRYDLYDEEEVLVESSDVCGELSAVFGFGQLSPVMERALSLARPGDTREVTLSALDAFGPRDPNAIFEVAREDFPAELLVGDEFEAESDDGALVPLRILRITDETVLVDRNHPLAGQRIHVELTVETVRPATEEELRVAERQLAEAPAEEEESGLASSLIAPGSLLRRPPSTNHSVPERAHAPSGSGKKPRS